MLNNGAKPNVKGEGDNTALMLAKRDNQEEIVKILEDAQKKKNQSPTPPVLSDPDLSQTKIPATEGKHAKAVKQRKSDTPSVHRR